MPFTTPLANLPTAWPSHASPITDEDRTSTQQFHTLLVQLRDWMASADGAIEEGGTQLVTVAALPTAVGKTGVRYMVSDANATTFMSTVAGGGANVVPVFSDGVTWRIG